MLKKDRYWILKNEEFEMMMGILKDTKEFQSFQKGAAINNLLLTADKAIAEYRHTQQPVPPAPEAPALPRTKKPLPKREVVQPEPEEEGGAEEEAEDLEEFTDEDF